MDKQGFLAKFAEQFDDTDPSEIQFSTHFHKLEEWSSLMGMCTIAMAKTEYDRMITGAEIKECDTIEDLYDLINSK